MLELADKGFQSIYCNYVHRYEERYGHNKQKENLTREKGNIKRQMEIKVKITIFEIKVEEIQVKEIPNSYKPLHI